MNIGTVIDPVARTTRVVQVDLNDFHGIQSAIGGYMFEEHAARLGDQIVGTVFMVEDRQRLPSQESFAFEELIVAGKRDLRIYGAALFVPIDETDLRDHIRCRFFPHKEAKGAAPPVIRTMSDEELERYISSGEAREKNATVITTGEFAVDGNPDQIFIPHFGREPRDFIPRPVGTFNSKRCSVYELEAAFLGFYEWVRKDNTFRHDSPIGRAFGAPPFFFPDGLEPTEEEFAAWLSVGEGELTLPFPMDSFWIVRWDSWLNRAGGGEGPALLHVEGSESGFTTREAFFDRRQGYCLGEIQQHERLRQVPGALVYALHRLNNRRQIIEHNIATPALERVNGGRAKSKHGLAPLPGFIRVTGRIQVNRGLSSASGIERCRHDRRGHWRKRRNGVELPPEEWVRIRPTTIHPHKLAPAPKPYLVV